MEIYKFVADTQLGVGVESLFFTVQSLHHASPLHCHDYYEIFLVIEGEAIHCVNGAREPISQGAMVFMRPEDIHAYDWAGEQDCRFINIIFRQEAMENAFAFLGKAFNRELLLNCTVPPTVYVTLLEQEHITGRLDRMGVYRGRDEKALEVLLRGLLIDLLVTHFGKFQIGPDERLPSWLEALLVQMQREDNFTAGLPRMYELSNRSPGHLNRVFRQLLHTTPVEYINQLKLNYTKHLLATTSLSVTDIALTAGFNNLSHYHHLFRRVFHRTPMEFRAEQPEAERVRVDMNRDDNVVT
ncbi:helix-turn-helix domain-containing protein [Paenibacillus swuensis]|uniref:helix-turn-helix domain-containing protein n=1 Tax=Paenibacillus swuensis TaxID=1178515 RepID=UPI000838DC31|nr:helix-turn-helix domain-containing protein [Paenibacillus swuensis]